MSQISYARRFPPAIIQYAVWLYFRFSLSYRDVEDLLAERGIDVSYETVRRWVLRFAPAYAARIRRRRPRPSGRWHLDEVFVRIGDRVHYLWRAMDDEGEVLDVLVQSRRDRTAALKLLRRLLKSQGCVPDTIVTDKLRSYVRRSVVFGSKPATSPVVGRTTWPRFRTNRPEGGSGNEVASDRQAPLRGSLLHTPPSTIISTFSVT